MALRSKLLINMIYVIKASTADQVNQLNHSLLKGADFGCQVENLIQE